MPELTEQQQAALPVLEWLFSYDENDRRTGRTTIMALAYIRIAVANPGRWIDVVDHYPTAYGRVLLDAIREMAVNLGVYDFFESSGGPRECRIRFIEGSRVSPDVEEVLFPDFFPTREDLERPWDRRAASDIQREEDDLILRDLQDLAKKVREGKAFKPPKPPPEPQKTLWDHLTNDSAV